MTMPTGPAVGAAGLDAALVELLDGAGAQSVRLIDLVSGRALAARAARPAPADPAADVALARLADAAFAAGATDGGWGDVVLAGPRALHVLVPGPHRSVLVLRLAPGADVGSARRAATAPRLAAALWAGHPAAPVPLPGQRGRSTMTGPLREVPTPRPPAALASVFDLPALDRAGTAPGPVAAVSLPRRANRGSHRAVGVFATVWNRDLPVMQRVLDGLRRLA